MTTESTKKQKTQENQPGTQDPHKRLNKRDEQEPSNPNAPKQRDQQGSDQGVKPTRPPKEGGTGSADPKFDQTKPLTDDWGKSDKH